MTRPFKSGSTYLTASGGDTLAKNSGKERAMKTLYSKEEEVNHIVARPERATSEDGEEALDTGDLAPPTKKLTYR